MIALKSGLVQLDEVIRQMEASARNYAAKAGASEVFIKIQNQILEKLIKAYNALELDSGRFLKYFAVWEDIERKIEIIEKKDDQITGHEIRFWTKFGKENFSYIPINHLIQ